MNQPQQFDIPRLREAVEQRIEWAQARLSADEDVGFDMEIVAADLRHWLRRYEMDCSALLAVVGGLQPGRKEHAVSEDIAKIKSTHLGYEDHGILTAWLQLDYGNSGQGAGGYALDQYDAEADERVGHKCGMDFVIGVLRACGVQKWEDVAGRTVIAVRDAEGFGGKVIGIKPLPTEPGKPFLFADAFEELAAA